MSTTFNFILDENGNVKVVDEQPTEDNATPSAGNIRYNSKKNTIEFYNGFVWISILGASEIKQLHSEIEQTVGHSTQKETFDARFDAVTEELTAEYVPETEVETIHRRFEERVNLLFNKRVQEILEHMEKYQEALDALNSLSPFAGYQAGQMTFDEPFLGMSTNISLAELINELESASTTLSPDNEPTLPSTTQAEEDGDPSSGSSSF